MAHGGWQAPQLSAAQGAPAQKARAVKEGSTLCVQPQAGPGGQTSDPAVTLRAHSENKLCAHCTKINKMKNNNNNKNTFQS